MHAEIVFDPAGSCPQRFPVHANSYRLLHQGLNLGLDQKVTDRSASLVLTADQSNGVPISYGLSWDFPNWSESMYVFMPAGAYNGNRFPSLKLPYSPRVPEDLVRGKNTPPIITDVPRLNHQPGVSSMQLRTGDLAFPGMGWFDPHKKQAWFVMASRPEAAADWMWEVEESEDRRTAWFRISAPAVRRSPIYLMPMMQRASPDQALLPEIGKRYEIQVDFMECACPDIPTFLDMVFNLRAKLAPCHEVPATVPFSTAFGLIEDHYHAESWRERPGLFASDCNPDSAYTFQTGWCGGMICTHALLDSQNSLTRQRVLQNLHTFFDRAPRPGGLFSGRSTKDGLWMADFGLDASRPYTHQWTLVRRQGDALLYLLRQVAFLQRLDPTFICPATWDQSLRKAAQLFVDLWKKEGEFGQFIHQETGEILVGGSASGAILPAALVAAWQRFGDACFLETASASGLFFARHFLQQGYTTGGPGDACQNPDSESAGALVESYAALFQATRDTVWLSYGQTASALLATWVMPYNFPFPPATEFQRLDIRTRGSVFANTQNKHAAPGICTHSGVGLLHLFRATGDTRLMDLLRDIARFMPQTVSRTDRPIHDKGGRPMPSGWMNERVNTSDWDDNIGGVFYGSCWCEVSLLLSAAELPGIYARPDLGRVWCLDHVDAELADRQLHLHNPTPFPCRVKLLVECADAASRPLAPLSLYTTQTIELAPDERVSLALPAS